MNRLAAITLTACVCLPLGVLTQRQASAQRVVGLDLEADVSGSHFERAQRALREANREIIASQRAGERVWHDDAGHGLEAKTAIDHAVRAVDRAAAWATDPNCAVSLCHVETPAHH